MFSAIESLIKKDAHQQGVCESHKLDVVTLLSHRLHIPGAELLHCDVIITQALHTCIKPMQQLNLRLISTRACPDRIDPVQSGCCAVHGTECQMADENILLPPFAFPAR